MCLKRFVNGDCVSLFLNTTPNNLPNHLSVQQNNQAVAKMQRLLKMKLSNTLCNTLNFRVKMSHKTLGTFDLIYEYFRGFFFFFNKQSNSWINQIISNCINNENNLCIGPIENLKKFSNYKSKASTLMLDWVIRIQWYRYAY